MGGGTWMAPKVGMAFGGGAGEAAFAWNWTASVRTDGATWLAGTARSIKRPLPTS